jgi:hypothetical protein
VRRRRKKGNVPDAGAGFFGEVLGDGWRDEVLQGEMVGALLPLLKR